MKTFGEYLRSERERRQIALDDLQRQIRVSMKFLKAFEDDDVANYPQETYARGFLRSYAKAVGLDENGIIKRYQYFLKKHKETQESLRRKRWKVLRRRVFFAFTPLIIAGFLIGSYVYFKRLTLMEQLMDETRGGETGGVEAESNASGSVSTESRPSSYGQEVIDTDLNFVITAKSETWVRVKIDGAREYTVLIGEGEQRKWTATESVDIEAGDPDAVFISFREQEYRLTNSLVGGSGTWHWPPDPVKGR